MNAWCKSLCVWMILGFLPPALLPGFAHGRSIEMPITIDYAFLQSLVISAAFPEPQSTALLVDQAEGCRRVALSEPQFHPEGDFVRMQTKVDIRMGARLGEKCRFKIHWDGYVSLLLNPRMDPERWRLGFDVIDARVYDSEHKPARVIGLIWKVIQGRVFEYLGGITVDLGPPVEELKALLPEVLPKQSEEKVRRIVDGMHSGLARVAPDAITIPIIAEIEENPPSEAAPPEHLDEEALAPLIGRWEDLDIFQVYLLTSLRSAPLSDEEREILLTALLEARHGFVEQLAAGTLTDGFVQDQFIATWQAVSPVFKRQLEGKNNTDKLIGYLSFFTAEDALKSLQAMGPSLGMEISRKGLARLAGLLADERAFGWVYDGDVDADLRKTFDLGGALEIPPEPAQEVSPQEEGHTTLLERVLKGLLHGGVAACWAAEAEPAGPSLKQWLVSQENVDTYIPAVLKILEEAARKTFQDADTEEQQKFIIPAVTATAWQESCWRQFHVRKGQFTYIRSYNGTSVGLMQVNERVWRGLYKLEALRWNIRYNALAGCDILKLYLTKYILKDKQMLLPDGQPDPDLVPRVLYAMYNGGPSEVRKFPARHKQAKYYPSDTLFWEKVKWVEAREWNKVKLCLFGEE